MSYHFIYFSHIYPPSSFSYASYPPTYFSYTYPILLSPSPKSVQSSNPVLLYLSYPTIPFSYTYPSIPFAYAYPILQSPSPIYLSYPPIPFSYTYHILQSPSPIPILSSNPLLLYLLLQYLSVLLLLLCLT